MNNRRRNHTWIWMSALAFLLGSAAMMGCGGGEEGEGEERPGGAGEREERDDD